MQGTEDERTVNNNYPVDQVSSNLLFNNDIDIRSTPRERRTAFNEDELRDKENELLRREIELLKLEREIVQNSRIQTTQAPSTSWIRTDDNVIPDFDPSRIEKLSAPQWIKKLESIASIYEWDGKMLLFHAIARLRGAAKNWYDSLETEIRTWEDFARQLVYSFPAKYDQADIHYELSRRTKKANETYEAYAYEMAAIGRKGELESPSIIKYIIAGIGDKELARVLSVCEIANVQHLLTRIKSYESFDKRVTTSRATAKANPTPMSGYASTTSRTASASEVNRNRCFNCGRIGHKSNDCRDKEKGRKCYSCQAYGHIARDCPKASTTQPTKREKALLAENEVKVNKDRFYKTIKIGNVSISCLIDTGCDLNLMTLHAFKKIDVEVLYKSKVELTGIAKQKVTSIGKFSTKLLLDDEEYEATFHVVDDDVIPINVLLGQNFFNNVELTVTPADCTLKKNNFVETEIKDEMPFALYQKSETPELSLTIDNKEYYKRICQLCENYDDNKQTKTTNITMKLILKNDEPIYQRPRRLAPIEKKAVEDQINVWLDEGVIKPSTSDYASPVVLTTKKNGSHRLCVDYRAINRVTVRERYPLPVIEDHIDRLRDAKIFSTIDLKSGFHHIPVNKECQKYTAFVTHDGQFEFLKMPFGLTNGPSVFQRFIHEVFRDFIIKNIVLVYIDDVVITAKTPEEGFENLKAVLTRAEEYGLRINWSKCHFMTNCIEYLGYVIEDNCVKPSPNKIEAVKKFKVPGSVKEIQEFLGLTGYFRKFIADYSLIAKPLSDLLRKDVVFNFGTKELQAFEDLKEKLASKPVLNIYSPEAETELHCDACADGLGAVLLQKEPPNIHRAKILFLQDFNYTIEHRAGSRMKHADALSRNAVMIAQNTEFLYRLKTLQREDESLKPIIALLEDDKKYGMYYLKHDLLYKEENEAELIVLPRKMYHQIIKKAHEENGHFSTKKTEEILKREYYIDNVRKRVEDVIRNCVQCILAERKTGKGEGFLHPLHKGDTPLYTVHLDHLGPLTATPKGYRYILAAIDAFTKFVWIYPTKTTSTKEVIERLKTHQSVFGNPKRFITDKGTAFTSNEFREYCESEKIELVHVTTGVPRGNGQVERLNRTIIPVLTKMCIEDGKTWYKHVNRLQTTLNDSYQRSIRMTPFELLVGVKMRKNENVKMTELIEEEYVKTYNEEREEMRKIAKEEIRKIQEENRAYYDKKRKKATSYRVGELVAIQRTQFVSQEKLRPKFMGPYKVTKVKRNERYDVERIGDGEPPRVTSTSADHMKPWSDDGYNEDDDVDLDLDETHDETVDKLEAFTNFYVAGTQLVGQTSPEGSPDAGRPNIGTEIKFEF